MSTGESGSFTLSAVSSHWLLTLTIVIFSLCPTLHLVWGGLIITSQGCYSRITRLQLPRPFSRATPLSNRMTRSRGPSLEPCVHLCNIIAIGRRCWTAADYKNDFISYSCVHRTKGRHLFWLTVSKGLAHACLATCIWILDPRGSGRFYKKLFMWWIIGRREKKRGEGGTSGGAGQEQDNPKDYISPTHS